MKHNIIQHTSFWDDKKHLPFDTRLMTLLLLTACGGGGGGGSGDRPLEVSLASVRVSRTGNEVEGTGQNDFIYINSSNSEPLNADDGDDFIEGSVSSDLVYGDKGNDLIHGHSGHDTLHGGQGDDVIIGGHGIDFLYGNQGNDVIFGGDGNDYIYGGAGNDYIDGGSGMDTLTGGAGVDIFAFYYDEVSIDADIITDFEVGIDRLEFVEGFETDERYFDIVQSGGDTSIYYTQSGQKEIIVTLQGVTDGVSFDDFLFYYAEVA